MTAPQRTSFGKALLLIALILVAVCAGWWAARTTLTPPIKQTASSVEVVTVPVEERTIGKSLNFAVTASTSSRPLHYNVHEGLITDVADSGVFKEGQIAYRVNAEPVIVIESSTPFYRELRPGLKGADVKAIQHAMKRLGFFTGDPDGVWGPATTLAVKAWQKDLVLPQNGVFTFGELVAVPQLPVQILVSKDVARGLPITSDTLALSIVDDNHSFTMPLGAEQVHTLPQDAAIEIFFDDHVWDAVIVSQKVDDNGVTSMVLEHPEGGNPCRTECDLLPLNDSVTLRSVQHVVPEITGPAVPVPALRTGENGLPYVTNSSGENIGVTILGASGGFAVVDGLTVSDLVVVSASEQAAAQPSQEQP